VRFVSVSLSEGWEEACESCESEHVSGVGASLPES